MKRVHAPRGIKRLRLARNGLIESSRGMFAYDSITVSFAWELISVSMCYSQGDGVNTSLSRLMYCTLNMCSFVFVPGSFHVCGYLPWHGHVLPGTKVINIMRVHLLNQQG